MRRRVSPSRTAIAEGVSDDSGLELAIVAIDHLPDLVARGPSDPFAFLFCFPSLENAGCERGQGGGEFGLRAEKTFRANAAGIPQGSLNVIPC
jgi:hypothetical protein